MGCDKYKLKCFGFAAGAKEGGKSLINDDTKVH